MIPGNSPSKSAARKRRFKTAIAAVVAAAGALATSLPVQSRKLPIPMRTSVLTGQRWLNELMTGHPERFREQLGLSKNTFNRLLIELQTHHGLRSSRHVAASEQLAIFLYLARTGCSSRMLRERFQRSGDTITTYVCRINKILVGTFYKKYVHLPRMDVPLPQIATNPKLFPFFEKSRGNIDGSLFHFHASEDATVRYRSRKGLISQNVLAACDQNMMFIYVLTGWEGSASDSRIFDFARRNGLKLPEDCYFLADAGFPLCDMLLTPYRGKRYHLKEWSQGSNKPKDHDELFNLRHAQARNVVERIFGIFKRRFQLAETAPEYDPDMQSWFVASLAALHNFIRIHDPTDNFSNMGSRTPSLASIVAHDSN